MMYEYILLLKTSNSSKDSLNIIESDLFTPK